MRFSVLKTKLSSVYEIIQLIKLQDTGQKFGVKAHAVGQQCKTTFSFQNSSYNNLTAYHIIWVPVNALYIKMMSFPLDSYSISHAYTCYCIQYVKYIKLLFVPESS